MRKGKVRVGIITFHCSHNFGAMLQAYGLKRYLCDKGIRADLIRYEPPFLTGRHWWFPYIPIEDKDNRKSMEKNMWKAHQNMGKDFFRQYANYIRFKRKYLVRKWHGKLLSSIWLKWLPYQYYIVGSDQIWNPDITLGLRKVYFGAFDSRRKEKVIAYAASLGGTSVPARYEEEFSRLLDNVDVISVREEEAVPYIEKFCHKEVTAVLDPVFLLRRESWQKVEKVPDREGYILVYTAERNEELYEYALKLSQEKGMPAIMLRASKWGEDEGFLVDYTAGPSEFLGYIHGADYVVTNSFHGVAFSIIYQKKFLAFLHSNLGARTRNILKIHELENRLYQGEQGTDIDDPIDWNKVGAKTEKSVKLSEKFLIDNILMHEENG